ncbi:DUF29 family protein [Desulfonema magnum]|uniref:DUF29 n=1 Tax=Desulfonema magnum TaxID=45655 RepID=A0A975BIY4_9BACT|nr:DUF29 family protein [Desulfonema magnum]QTA86180.1 DUF29 [Desulfonema magnum]
MEELLELKTYITQGNYAEALNLIGEMEEMSRDDKISKIFSYAEILLIHLIKKHAEKRTTRSWDASIKNSVYRINYVNKRRKAGGYYLKENELEEVIEDAWEMALLRASFEAFEGCFDETELAGQVDAGQISAEAMRLITKGRIRK